MYSYKNTVTMRGLDIFHKYIILTIDLNKENLLHSLELELSQE